MLRKLLDRLRFSNAAHILVAQYRELKRQIPLLYALLIVNAWKLPLHLAGRSDCLSPMIDDPFLFGLTVALAKLAASAEAQSASDFPPEELRLEWEDALAVAQSHISDEGFVGKAIRAFNELLGSLPPEPDPMWHRDNLDKHPWPTIRARASDLLVSMLRRSTF